MNEDLVELVRRCVSERGEQETTTALRTLLRSASPTDTRVLTIVANAGVHEIPREYLRGEVFLASHGNWKVSSDVELRAEVQRILIGVATKLRQRAWQTVHLVPTGHPIVSMQIKALVYRALRINTIDLVYLNGTYYTLDLDQREIAITAGTTNPGGDASD